MGKIILAWANFFLAWVNSFVNGQNHFSMGKFFLSMGEFICAWANSLLALANYFSMGKVTFAWSTDTDALAHGQIHFCAQTFFGMVNNTHTECARENENAGGIPKIMIFMTLAGSYTFLAMSICAAGVSQCR